MTAPRRRTQRAGNPKLAHGGKRPHAGRKPSAQYGKARTHQVMLYAWHVARLRQIDPRNLSRAIRRLIETHYARASQA